MGYKEQNWVKYGRQGDIIELVMRDHTNAKIESWRCNDNHSYNNALKTIWQKYGDKFKPKPKFIDEDELSMLRDHTSNI